MTFAILGPLEVRRDGEPVEIAGQRLRTLLGLLLLDAGSTVTVETLVAGVWDDRPPHAPLNALQALVSRLRGALGKNSGHQLLVADPAGYRLAVEAHQVDAHRFAVLAGQGKTALTSGDARGAAALLREALALWRGHALADLADNQAAAGDVARLNGMRLAAIEDRIEADLLLGRNAEVLAELPGLLAAHPLRERLHGQHMRALYGAGREVEALAAYESARAMFSEQLGADPSPELAELHLAILRREESDEVRQARGNLRARLTSFVGREGDIDHTTSMLGRHRLVTLIGPGGAGKTRLAVEAAATVSDEAWLAELAPVADEAGVVQAVVSALRVRDTFSPDGQIDRLIRILSGRRLLLVLDNCEHVIDHAARLADRLLAECAGVRILATSREPLAITGEITWALPPLGLPPADGDPQLAMGYPAVRLFADRAAAVLPGYDVAGEIDAVVRICRELDGMPLAIELAAARLRSLSAKQIADRLDDRFRLLTGGSRTALPRHQTLRAVVDWSWELLDDDERVLARRLAAFAGGATLEAAEQICGGDVLDPLARLVDKSLVIHETGRYRMLETIRAYAAERLAGSGEEQRVRWAHAEHFTALAERADPGLRRAGQLELLEMLTAEHDNLSAALRWTAAHDPELGLRLVGALGWYWWLRGHRVEGATRSRELLELAADAPASLRAVPLAVYGLTATGAALPWADTPGRPGEALVESAMQTGTSAHPLVAMATPMAIILGAAGVRHGDAVLAPMLGHEDPWVVAGGHLYGGLMKLNDGGIDEGVREVHLALDGYRSVGDRWGIGTALGTLSDIAFLRGDPQTGISVMREALEVMDAIGALEDTPYMRVRLAIGLNQVGEREQARRLLEEVALIVTRIGDKIGEAGVVAVWAEFARQDGDVAAARRHYARAMEIAEYADGSPPTFMAALHSSMGLLALQVGDLERARLLLGQALDMAEAPADAQVSAIVLVACAALALAQGSARAAAVLLGGAESVKGIAAVADYDHVRITEDVRGALTAQEFTHHFARGKAMPKDAILTLARTL